MEHYTALVWTLAASRQSTADIHAANTARPRSLALQCNAGVPQKVVSVPICMKRPGQWCSVLTQPAYTTQHQWGDTTRFESRLPSSCVPPSPQPLLRTGDSRHDPYNWVLQSAARVLQSPSSHLLLARLQKTVFQLLVHVIFVKEYIYFNIYVLIWD